MSDLDDEVGFHALRNHGFCETILLLPYTILRDIGGVVRRAGFRSVDYTHHFAGLESIPHSNRPHIIVLLVLEPITFHLGNMAADDVGSSQVSVDMAR